MIDRVKSQTFSVVAGLAMFLVLCGTAGAAGNPQAHQPSPDAGAYSWNTGEYLYDDAGNIIAIGNEYFKYDVDGRLVSATIKEPDGTQYVTRTYSYDGYGNLNSRAIGNATTAIGVSTTNNHLTATGTTY